jgi:7-keto-8-aminopelargonate synthetase-like enzyme
VPDSSARLRFFLSSEHTEAQIRQTVAAVRAVMSGAQPAETAR